MSIRKRQIVIILSVLFLVLVFDQVTKAIVLAQLPEGTGSLREHPGEFFWFAHHRNTGLVGGMFRSNPMVALAAPLFATCVLVYLFTHLNPRSIIQSSAYGMVAGGALGNLIDRLRLGSVTDFLQFHFYFIPFDFPWKLYPAFNIADSAICVGVFLLILLSWRQADEKENANVSDAS